MGIEGLIKLLSIQDTDPLFIALIILGPAYLIFKNTNLALAILGTISPKNQPYFIQLAKHGQTQASKEKQIPERKSK